MKHLALRFFFMSCYKDLGQTYEYDDLFMTIAGGIFSLLCGIITPFWGWVNKKMGFRLTLAILVACEVITDLFI